MEQRLKLKSDLAELDKLHNYIERFGRKLCLSKKYVVEINLVLEEVFSNIVAYAYEDRGEHFIKISVIPSGNGNIVLRVEDKGRPFNPLDATQPDMTYDLEHCEIGGLGIHLVKNLMDDVRYDYRDDKNVLEMKKSIASTCRQSSNTAD